MPNRMVVGAQWGDEGKGRITDYLAQKADLVVRYQGGDNAGHTVIIEDKEFKFHLIPSGILYPEKTVILGSGMVVNPDMLCEELDRLKKRGISTDSLRISGGVHLIFPYHLLRDQFEEENKKTDKIGTTGRGIGPAYTDKISRRGIKFNYLYFPDMFKKILKENYRYYTSLFKDFYKRGFYLDFDKIFNEYLHYGEILKPYLIENLPLFLEKSHKKGKSILFEGAQGTLLDIDHGTYPYVTSSNPSVGGAVTGTGFKIHNLDKILGVAKAYLTRVGKGTFPTEIKGELGEKLREKGGEYGVTTGRPRRCGWLDLPLLRHAARINNFTGLVITKLDVLSGFESIKVCTGYKINGELHKNIIPELCFLENAEPVYKTMKGWEEKINKARKFEDLPKAARDYVEFISQEVDLNIFIISVGPQREELIQIDS